jgi:hypothetical protein
MERTDQRAHVGVLVAVGLSISDGQYGQGDGEYGQTGKRHSRAHETLLRLGCRTLQRPCSRDQACGRARAILPASFRDLSLEEEEP